MIADGHVLVTYKTAEILNFVKRPRWHGSVYFQGTPPGHDTNKFISAISVTRAAFIAKLS